MPWRRRLLQAPVAILASGRVGAKGGRVLRPPRSATVADRQRLVAGSLHSRRVTSLGLRGKPRHVRQGGECTEASQGAPVPRCFPGPRCGGRLFAKAVSEVVHVLRDPLGVTEGERALRSSSLARRVSGVGIRRSTMTYSSGSPTSRTFSPSAAAKNRQPGGKPK